MNDELKLLSNAEALGEDGTKKTLRGVFGLNMSTVIVAAICGILIATAIFEPTKTGASLYEIIVNSVAIYVSTMAINYLLRDKAIRDAKDLPLVQTIIGEFNGRVKRVIENNEMDDLDEWCAEKNAANYRDQRKRILASVGLKYDEFFDGDGEYTGKEIHIPRLKEIGEIGLWTFPREWRLAVRRSKAVVKARYLRLAEISAQTLTSEGDNANDRYRMGRDETTYKRQTTKSQASSKILLAVILGYYTAAVIANFSPVNLALKIMQVVFAIVMGLIDYLTATGYVVNELMGRYAKKTRIIDQYHGSRKEVTAYSGEVSREHRNNDKVVEEEGAGNRELHAVAGADL